jgi:hypothetical protein
VFAVLTVMYIWFITLQFNDVDAALWVIGYGIAALFSSAIAFDIRPRLLQSMMTIYSVLVLFWIMWLLPSIQGVWWEGEVEREVGGLTIVLTSQIPAIVYLRRMSRL